MHRKIVITAILTITVAALAVSISAMADNTANKLDISLKDQPSNGQISKNNNPSTSTAATIDYIEPFIKEKPESTKVTKITIDHGRNMHINNSMQVNTTDHANEEDFSQPYSNNIPGLGLTVSDHKNAKADFAETVEKAVKAIKLGQIESAINLYHHALSIQPDNDTALFGLAAAYQMTGQLEEARKLYTKLLHQSPNNQYALNNFLGLIGQEAPEGAILELKKLEAINPTLAIIPAQISMIYLKLNDKEQAITYFIKALALEPENMRYAYNLAILYDQTNNKRMAIKLYKTILAADYNHLKDLPESIQKINERLAFLSTQL